MAIIINGKSKCAICKLPLNKTEEIIMFPSFVHNSKDPFYIFNDAGVHKNCIGASSLGEFALEYLSKMVKNGNSQDIRLDVDNNPIENFDNLIHVGLLTSDVREELSDFNFTKLNITKLKSWELRDKFIATAKRYKAEGKWGNPYSFDYLEWLIKQIESA